MCKVAVIDCFVLLLFICVNVQFVASKLKETKDDLAVLHYCNTSNPVSLEAINSVLMKREIKHPETKTKEFKCFLLCLYVEYNWMDQNGNFDLRNMKWGIQNARISRNRKKLLLHRCTTTDLTNPCERALHFTQCFWSDGKNDKLEVDERGNDDDTISNDVL